MTPSPKPCVTCGIYGRLYSDCPECGRTPASDPACSRCDGVGLCVYDPAKEEADERGV